MKHRRRCQRTRVRRVGLEASFSDWLTVGVDGVDGWMRGKGRPRTATCESIIMGGGPGLGAGAKNGKWPRCSLRFPKGGSTYRTRVTSTTRTSPYLPLNLIRVRRYEALGIFGLARRAAAPSGQPALCPFRGQTLGLIAGADAKKVQYLLRFGIRTSKP